ncbi:MAG TPA: glutaminyl-peptide cyclotransferase [Bacteroidia bacterium]|jgi:glutamine cyclotransferase|nr:glutaminyl-peptide cyclotransferase [Bacteroidia bacterium]
MKKQIAFRYAELARPESFFRISASLRTIKTAILKQVKGDNKLIYSLFIILSVFLFSCAEEKSKPVNTEEKTAPSVPVISYSIAAILPHDSLSFTEGLLFHKGELFESTGSPDDLPQTKSLFGICNLKTGKINVKAELDRTKYFGEGIVFFNDKVYQLTYKNQTGFIYDGKTFKKTGEFTYANKEGWGLTSDGTNIIMSDGTNNLTFLDPATLKPIRTLAVTENGYAGDYLNELEYIKGFIYANVWTTNSIVKINPVNGKIVGKLLLAPLFEEVRYKYNGAKEMNGIAYNQETDKIYITGKMWPNIYEINFAH